MNIKDNKEELIERLLNSEIGCVSKNISDDIKFYFDSLNDKYQEDMFNRIKQRYTTFFKDNDNYLITYPNDVVICSKKGVLKKSKLKDEEAYNNTLKNLIEHAANVADGPLQNEYIFVSEEGYEYKREPNGCNKKPDGLITFSDGSTTYIEIKTVYCYFDKNNKLNVKINSATEPTETVINDIKNDDYVNNGKSIYNITTVFLFYYVDVEAKSIYYFNFMCVPQPLTIHAVFNKDGFFDRLGLKSNTNENTTLSLSLLKLFNNEYNSLMDRFWMIKTGYSTTGLKHLITNIEAKYHNQKKLFDNIMKELDMMIIHGFPIYDVKLKFDDMKSLKFHLSKIANEYDKLILYKSTIKYFKKLINNIYGKTTVR